MPGFFFSGHKLREIRERQDMSRELLAVAVGITANAITRYETGHGQPSIATLGALGNALGVDPRDLIVPADELEAAAR